MRRFGARWRDATTPREVLDIFRIEGRYEVLLNGEWASGLDIDDEGFRYPSFELDPYQARAYRYRNGKRRVAWASLPLQVRATVLDWIAEP